MLIDLFPNYKVILDAAGGKDFIRQLNPLHLPDILLLDITMPEMDGCALSIWVTEHYPAIRILALSTMDNELNIIRMLRCGARGYIPKDAEPYEFKQAFEEILAFRPPTPAESAALRDSLEKEQLIFLRLACTEKTYYDIAEEMAVNIQFIENHRDRLFNKWQISTRIGLVLFALRHGIV